jgi:acyl dehydratase
MIDYDAVEVGTELPAQQFRVERQTLVQYAGASGDFNPIHWNDRVAVEVGLPDVIAHGMLTMAEAIRVVTDWVGDPGAVVEYAVRFTRPVVVPEPGGTVLQVSGRVTAKHEELLDIDLKATVDGQTVLAKARAVIRVARRTREEAPDPT